MNIDQIEKNLQGLVRDLDKEEFIYELLLAYGLPKASITRLKKGSYDLSDNENVVSWKKRVYFKEEHEADLHNTLMELADKANHEQRFIIVTDFDTLLARDTKTKENLDVPIKDLPRHYDFFLPWAGMEKAEYQSENPADVKAAERMAKLFDEIKKDNPDDSPEFIHGLNVFLSRLLFCFFAEDTEIFLEGQFTKGVSSHTQSDGSDLNSYLDKLFDVLNTKKSERTDLPAYLDAFPYVNGGLFKDKISSPVFTRRSRQAIIDSGELNWSAINPDIFGSMMQAVITPEHRGGLGMHYTSVPNIMKVIKPLFLDDLYEVFEKGYHEPKKLINLLERISKIKIFDPACGSGNFLIISYKELRRLEMKIIRRMIELQKMVQGFQAKAEQLSMIPKSQLELAESYQVDLFSRVQLTQFYGIELDGFAHEIAQLSLWLAEHQMNVEFYEEFGQMNPTLPLKEAGKIVQGNACRIDWETVCPKGGTDEIYILGNPPYLGYSRQSKSNKDDLSVAFSQNTNHKKLDYISAWFILGSRYIKDTENRLAFVTTNSITQGIQVSLLWPTIFRKNLEINFAHRPFKWNNNAKSNAGVYVVIIGLGNSRPSDNRFIFDEYGKKKVKKINPYLIEGESVFVNDRKETLSPELNKMVSGIKAGDDGNLILSEDEKNILLEKEPEAKKYIKKYIGAREFMNGTNRFCIWVEDDQYENAKKIPSLAKRFDQLRKFRLASKKKATRKKSNKPYAFDETTFVGSNSILIPQTGSERRLYLPIGFLDASYVISNAARAIYDAKPWLFGLLSSRMHITWVKAVAGRLKMDMQYSNTLCYNTFPFPKISDQRKQEITQCVFRILEERENHPEKTLAELYDPDKMPQGLLEAHQANDEVIEKCYRSRPFESDEQRLEYLFKLYEEMIEEEKQRETLFEKQKKKRRR
ncbi:MAG TPA: DNA methyltransferase [Balneolaceae bacterium]|nr:DNA methyltransferase [Balneolaceae bacterium]